MIDTREQLIHVLTEAAEVEHNLLCSYLYAVFSLKRAGEEGLSEAQGEAVERWRKLILSVALEEMTHLACVNNLLLAVGGATHFDRPNLPVAPGYHPAGVVVRLTPFDAETLEHFIFLERPVSARVSDAPGFASADAGREVPGRPLTPSAIDYATIGELYDALAEGFTRLSAELGEHALIDPGGLGQVDVESARLPGVTRVASLAEALAVITLIKEQGEGASGDIEDSHFQRFLAIQEEWAALSAAAPDFQPAWPAAHDPVMRRPLDMAERVWVTEPEAADLLDLGNAAYGGMLNLLSQAFGAGSAADQAHLMRAGVELMELSAAMGVALARRAATAERSGVNAGLTFTVPRNLGRRPRETKRHLLERVDVMQRRAEAILGGALLAKALRRCGACAEALGKLAG